MKQLFHIFLEKYKQNDIYVYYLVMFMAGIINFCKNIIYAKILGPEELGYYSVVILLSIFCLSFCSLGLYEGSLGTFPLMYGQGKAGEVESLRDRTSGFILILSGILIAIACLVAAIYPFQNPTYQKILIVCAAFAGSQQYLSFLMIDMRSRLMTIQFGWVMFWKSCLSLAIGIIAASHYGFMGIMVGEIIISMTLVGFIIRYRMENYHLSFDAFSTLRPIFRVGIPLMFNNIIVNLASNMEKFFIISVFGTFLFGQYSFAMLVVTGAALFQGIVYQHISPSILYSIGNGGNVSDLLKKINRLVMVGGFCLILFWYPFSEIIKFIVPKYFKGYEYTVKLFPLIYIGAGFMVLSQYEHFIIAYRKTQNIMYSNFLVILLLFAFLLTIYLLKLPLIFFAVSFVIGRGIYFVITYYLSRMEIRDRIKLEAV